MDARSSEANWALSSCPWPLEMLRSFRIFRLARRESLTTDFNTAGLLSAATPQLLPLPSGASFAARSALSQRRLRSVLSLGVAVEALTSAAESSVRFSGASAQRLAAGGSAQGARTLLRSEVVAARLYWVEFARVLLLRVLAWGVACFIMGYFGIHHEQRVTARPFGPGNTFATYRVYLGVASVFLVLAALSHLIPTYLTLRALTTAIDMLALQPQPPAAFGAGPSAPPAPLSDSQALKLPVAAEAAVALNPLAAAVAAAPPPPPQAAGGPAEWAAPRPPPTPTPPTLRDHSFAQAVTALGAGLAGTASLPAHWAATQADLLAVRERARARAFGSLAMLTLVAAGAAAALHFALSATTGNAYRLFTGGAFFLAWLVGWIPALAEVRGRVEAVLAIAEGARTASAGLQLGSYVHAPRPCTPRWLLRALLCPCRLMRPSPPMQ